MSGALEKPVQSTRSSTHELRNIFRHYGLDLTENRSESDASRHLRNIVLCTVKSPVGRVHIKRTLGF